MDDERELLARARDWMDADPDPETRRELRALIDAEDLSELGERFARPLSFGTAGLRGIVGAGPARMNRAVVIRTTRALAEHLLENESKARSLPVVVAFDARRSSRDLADAAIRVLAGAGIPVRYFPEPAPTPLLAYAVRKLGASAGIVVTASHNPAEYNGYKLYGRNGVQVVPPADVEIEGRIGRVGPATRVPLAGGDLTALHGTSPVPDSMADRYLSEIDGLRPGGDADRSLRIVYTPLHGVGGALATRALSNAGFANVTVVPEQAAPDGAFPTVRFPNPEEAGALDLAVRRAADDAADLVLANDPDADRLAVCVKDGARWVRLTGNQIGILLADFVLEHTPRSPRPLVVSTIVSSPMLADVATAHGARSETTLTGFKWIWSAALHLERVEGVRFAFGYEEAIGFSVGQVVRDKDGIGAALVFAELAARCRASGRSVLDRLRSLEARHGLWASAQLAVVRPGLAGAREIDRAVDRVAASPPAEMSGLPVRSVTDFRQGSRDRPFWRGATPLVALDLGPSGRALVRPSGTEPKLKIYVDLRRDVGAVDSVAAAERALEADAAALASELARLLGLG